MKNYALLDENNKVINVSVADETWDSTGWIEYPSDKNVYIGGSYINGNFCPPQPFESWILNQDTYLWDPPVPKPDDGNLYRWDEETLSWIELTPTE